MNVFAYFVTIVLFVSQTFGGAKVLRKPRAANGTATITNVTTNVTAKIPAKKVPPPPPKLPKKPITTMAPKSTTSNETDVFYNDYYYDRPQECEGGAVMHPGNQLNETTATVLYTDSASTTDDCLTICCSEESCNAITFIVEGWGDGICQLYWCMDGEACINTMISQEQSVSATWSKKLTAPDTDDYDMDNLLARPDPANIPGRKAVGTGYDAEMKKQLALERESAFVHHEEVAQDGSMLVVMALVMLIGSAFIMVISVILRSNRLHRYRLQLYRH